MSSSLRSVRRFLNLFEPEESEGQLALLEALHCEYCISSTDITPEAFSKEGTMLIVVLLKLYFIASIPLLNSEMFLVWATLLLIFSFFKDCKRLFRRHLKKRYFISKKLCKRLASSLKLFSSTQN